MLRYIAGCSVDGASAAQPPSASSPIMAIIARFILFPRFGGVIAYQPWLNGERGAGLGQGDHNDHQRHHPRKRVAQYSVRRMISYLGEYWIPAFAGMTALPVALFVRGENPVTAGLQPDNIAGPQLPVPWRVDLDH